MRFKLKFQSIFSINLIISCFFICYKAIAMTACDGFPKPGIEIKKINNQINLFSTGEANVLMDDPSFYDFAYANAEENAKIKLFKFLSKDNQSYCIPNRIQKNKELVISKSDKSDNKYNGCKTGLIINKQIRGIKNHKSCYTKGKLVRVTIVASQRLNDVSKKMMNIIDNEKNTNKLMRSDKDEYKNINNFKSF